MRFRVFLAGFFAALVMTASGGAFAQCTFDQSSPSANDVIQDAQPDMYLQFMPGIDLQEVRIVDLNMQEYATNWTPTGEDEVFRTDFRPEKPLPPGSYLIEWTGDHRRGGHIDSGSVYFTVAGGDTPAGQTKIKPAVGSTISSAPRTGPGSLYPTFLGAGAPPPGR
ncbi:copper resistance protein CopC [Terrihabitans sp. B22-R8]|uniref:copper resistance protein CopC n=1 Tax=Terrihabitans sp. B22-R8 TaxID=3425128 RepID=UPI00403CC7E0